MVASTSFEFNLGIADGVCESFCVCGDLNMSPSVLKSIPIPGKEIGVQALQQMTASLPDEVLAIATLNKRSQI